MANADPRELAAEIADGHTIDWEEVLPHVRAEDATVVQSLSRISGLMQAHRRLVREHLPFETWGKLRLLEKIGEGAYGEVFRAWDESLGREVALKLFRQKQNGASVKATITDQQAEDLLLEARRLARVRHENVVRVYGAEEHRHRTGFWMELVTGETLSALMHGKGAMEPAQAAHIGVKLCGGLAAIHQSGLLHRDIKAQNVMCEGDGRIVLTDMGAGADLRFTASGLPRSIAGTPLYMAPELIEGRGGNHTADIYSVGILLYYLVTGRYPFENQTYEALRGDHAADRRTGLLERDPSLPAEFVAIVERATAHDPRNRYQTAADLQRALEPLAIDPDGRASKPTWTRPVFLVILAIVLMAGGLWAKRDWLAPDPAATEAVAPAGQTRRLTFSGISGIPLFSPDGQSIAYASGGARKVNLMSSDGRPGQTFDIPDGKWGFAWGWNPNGRSLLTIVSSLGAWLPDIMSLNVNDGSFQTLVEEATFPELSPGGRLLAFHSVEGGKEGGIDVIDLSTGERKTIIENPGEGMNVYKPHFTPDGRRLVYFRWAGWGHELWIANIDGTEQQQIPTGPLQPSGRITVTRDGKYVLSGAHLYGVHGIWRIALDGSSRVALTQGGSYAGFTSSEMGSDRCVFAQATQSSRLAMVSMVSGEVQYPAHMELEMRQPVISSDGSKIYFQAMVNGIWQIWQSDRNGEGSPRPLIAQEGYSCFSPAPAEHGILHLRGGLPNTTMFGEFKWDQTVWISTEDGGMSRPWGEGGTRVNRLAPGGERGGRVLFARSEGVGESVYVSKQDEKENLIDTDCDEYQIFHFDWGEDPQHVALFKVGNTEPWVVVESCDLETGEHRTLFDDTFVTAQVEGASLHQCKALASSPDGTRLGLLLRDGASELNRILEYSYASGSLREVQQIPSDHAGGYLSWSPDSAEIAVTLTKTSSDIYVWEPEVADAAK